MASVVATWYTESRWFAQVQGYWVRGETSGYASNRNKGGKYEKFAKLGACRAFRGVYAHGVRGGSSVSRLRSGAASSGGYRTGCSTTVLLSERLSLFLPERSLALFKIKERTVDGAAAVALAERDQAKGQGRTGSG